MITQVLTFSYIIREHPKTMDLDSIKQQLQNVLEAEYDEDECDC